MGFLEPVHAKVVGGPIRLQVRADFKRDMFNIFIGIIWQTSLIVLPLYIVLRDGKPMFEAIVVLIITSLILKKTWWNKITD